MLYMWVMTSIPEAKTMFNSSEIALNADGDNWPMFIDGWGNPIGFLRWAPGATVVAGNAATTGWSDVQIDDTSGNNFHHDPFDHELRRGQGLSPLPADLRRRARQGQRS